MNTVGIIAEYNPFHNGHLYQIEEIRKNTGAQNIIVVMSGDFVQRGAPAWTDKYLRTKMALSCGVSCVFELPVSFATASAEAFALAGVSLLTSLGFVDGLCFGCECSDIALLKELSGFLASPAPGFNQEIAALTARGLSYPAARKQALCNAFPVQGCALASLLSSPNNILALEYLKAISLLQSPLVPVSIQRKGGGYHNDKLTGAFSSASAIRKSSLTEPDSFPAQIAHAVPQEVYQLLAKQANHYPITENHFSDLLYYRLSGLTEEDRNILDMTDEIYYRIQNRLSSYMGYSEFIKQIKTRQYTYSRISRVLLHCLLHIGAAPIQGLKNRQTPVPPVPYARLLGFVKEKSALLRTPAKLPVITKPADGPENIKQFYSEAEAQRPGCSQPACQMYLQDIRASNLYRQIQSSALGLCRPDEYHSRPVIQE